MAVVARRRRCRRSAHGVACDSHAYADADSGRDSHTHTGADRSADCGYDAQNRFDEKGLVPERR